MSSDKKLDKIRDIIIETVQPDKIILFGSRATGEFKEDSDYDIFILKRGITNERTITNAVNRALFDKNIFDPIDIVASNPEKFEHNKNNPYRVYKDIFYQGITLYG